MLGLLLLTLVPTAMWLTQTTLLMRAGLPVRASINAADLPRRYKGYNRTVTYAALVSVVLVYPLLRGESPLSYYAGFFPAGQRSLEVLQGYAAATLYLALLYAVWLLSGNVFFRVRHSPVRLVQRLAGVPSTALLVALLEELLFRAMLLADLLEWFEPYVAVLLGATVFAGAHYVRSVKRYWTIGGHLGLGLLLCVAFLYTRALWLPIGLHAAGIVLLLGTRPFIRYEGPAWLTGASIFPYAGIAGMTGLLLLTINVYLVYGGS